MAQDRYGLFHGCQGCPTVDADVFLPAGPTKRRSDLDPFGHRGIGSHRGDGIANQSRLPLPDGFETPAFRVTDEVQPITQIVRILQVKCNMFYS